MQACLFCLDLVEKEQGENPIGCACRIVAHRSCFTKWFEQKQQLECPICHTVAVPNRIAHENIHIVYINTRDVNRTQRREMRTQDKAALFCCCLLMGWSIGLTILNLAFEKG